MMQPKGIGRRDFMRAGAGIVSAGLAVAQASGAQNAAPDAEPYKVHWYPFTEHPDSDTCWSLSVGPDGRIYAAACAEGVPGGVVKPGLLVNCALYHCGGKNHLVSPDVLM